MMSKMLVSYYNLFHITNNAYLFSGKNKAITKTCCIDKTKFCNCLRSVKLITWDLILHGAYTVNFVFKKF